VGTRIKNKSDAFGHALNDYLNDRGPLVEVIERDDGYIATSGGGNQYFASYLDWPPHQQRAMRYVRGRVLDIGCGAGSHALYLQRKGFVVLGIDVSPLAIAVCKRRGLKRARVLSIDHVTPKVGMFDTILLLGANFGLLRDLTSAKRMLRRLYKATTEGARIIAESRDPYRTTEPFHLAYHARNRRRGRMGGQVRIRVRYRKYATPWFDYLFVSRTEMREILKDTGWEIHDFLSSRSPTYAAVIEKTSAQPRPL